MELLHWLTYTFLISLAPLLIAWIATPPGDGSSVWGSGEAFIICVTLLSAELPRMIYGRGASASAQKVLVALFVVSIIYCALLFIAVVAQRSMLSRIRAPMYPGTQPQPPFPRLTENVIATASVSGIFACAIFIALSHWIRRWSPR